MINSTYISFPFFLINISLGEQHVGYKCLDFPSIKLSVVGGRPFSCGGDRLLRPRLLSKWLVRDMITNTYICLLTFCFVLWYFFCHFLELTLRFCNVVGIMGLQLTTQDGKNCWSYFLTNCISYMLLLPFSCVCLSATGFQSIVI